MTSFSISGRIVDVHNRQIFAGKITVKNGLINEIKPSSTVNDFYIMPGLVDSHIHIESTMLIPSRFSQLIVPHGTIGVVTDPHEIANVLGVEGVEFMIQDAKNSLAKMFFGAPSCVPATTFETSGATISSADVEKLLSRNDVWFLSEMMNFPGVINNDAEIISKLNAANKYQKPIDGHAPGVRGDDLMKYVGSGISTDHECATLDEALEKISRGMIIQICEGSAARNFEALHSLINSHPDNVMLCTDDIHPDELLKNGHINKLLELGVSKGLDLFSLLRSATVVPVQHYNLPVGLLKEGDPADFIVLKNLTNFEVLQTWIDGKQVYNFEKGVNSSFSNVEPLNKFRSEHVTVDQLSICLPSDKTSVKVIDVEDGELITKQSVWIPKLDKSRVIYSDVDDDVIKLVAVNRYQPEKPAVGFVRNIGLKKGAIGSTVAHDSHNIIVAGVDDDSILKIVNALIEVKGGIASFDGTEINILPLPVAGLMSLETGEVVAEQYQKINNSVAQLGSTLSSPFMSLSFLSLLVIPSLKLGDKGLFDVDKFEITSLFI